MPLRGRSSHRLSVRNMRVIWWSYGDSNSGPLACHEARAQPLTSPNVAGPAKTATQSDAEQRRTTPANAHLLPRPLPRNAPLSVLHSQHLSALRITFTTYPVSCPL